MSDGTCSEAWHANLAVQQWPLRWRSATGECRRRKRKKSWAGRPSTKRWKKRRQESKGKMTHAEIFMTGLKFCWVLCWFWRLLTFSVKLSTVRGLHWCLTLASTMASSFLFLSSFLQSIASMSNSSLPSFSSTRSSCAMIWCVKEGARFVSWLSL